MQLFSSCVKFQPDMLNETKIMKMTDGSNGTWIKQ